MSANRMTADQLRATETLRGDLAIRAGAGSGKTTVLSKRFASAVRVGGGGEAADRLLTITFTTKAAAELAERVGRVLTQEGLTDEANRIDAAWISTIHSFCGRLLRRHVLEAGVEPFFGQANEVTASALMTEAFESALDSIIGDEPGLEALVEGMSLSQLGGHVIDCHNKARALGLDPSTTTVDRDPAFVDELVGEVLARAEALQDALTAVKQTTAVARTRARVEEWRAGLAACALGQPDACEILIRQVSAYDVRAPAGLGDLNTRVKASCEQLLRLARSIRHQAELEAFERLVREYSAHYAAAKAQRGLMDFDDLQERAVALLEQREDVARRYREHFDLIMVDEFQDTNELQTRVLDPIRSDNLCVVGDERQSIYGFRYADVDIFRRTVQTMDTTISLSENFRSHEGILQFVNGLFSQAHMFGPEFMQLTAGRKGRWVLPPRGLRPRVECIFVDKEQGIPIARKAEADLIAERIAALLADGVHPGDVAVLLRASGRATLYAEALERRGVPVLVTAGADLLQADEARRVMSLLRVIAVPADDEALTDVLSGPIVSVSDDALLSVRRAADHGPLWDGLEAIAASPEGKGLSRIDKDVLARTHAKLVELGTTQGHISLSELVVSACEAFDYDLTLHAQGARGVRAWANIEKIARHAEAFEKTASRDPAEFVEFLKRMTAAGGDKPAPADAGGSAVRVMTVHAAKGLEFPVVFVADLAVPKKHDVSPVLVRGAVVDGRRMPLVGVALPKDSFGGATNGAHLSMAQEQLSEDLEEEKRCLYVACTRAEELLVVSGACELGKEPESGTGHIDWIRQGLAGDGEGEARLGGATVTVTNVYPGSEQDDDGEVTEYDFSAPIIAYDDAPAARTACPSPSLPSSVSYSALHLHKECPLSFHAKYRLRLDSLKADASERALEFGSAVHAALQAGVSGELTLDRMASLIRRHGLDPKQGERLREACDAFLGSDLAARVRSSDRFSTEQPIMVPLKGTRLLGSIDLIAWNAERALIIDYKSGAAPRETAERTSSYELQAKCYALAALEAGAAEVEVVFAFVEHDDTFVTYRFEGGDAEHVKADIGAIVDEISAETQPWDRIPHLPEYRAELCEKCPAIGLVCPIEKRFTSHRHA